LYQAVGFRDDGREVSSDGFLLCLYQAMGVLAQGR
jgi:hypothetical protein